MGLHLIDGEKGGVGKSFFATMMVEYCLYNKIPFRLIESDITTPDIERSYPNLAEKLEFGNEEGQMKVLDQLLEDAQYQIIIVNLPSRIKQRLDYWIQHSQVLEILHSGELASLFYKWFVITGQSESMLALKESCLFYGKERDHFISHIVVENQGMLMPQDWADLKQRESYVDLLEKQVYGRSIDGTCQVIVPKLSQAELSNLAEKEIPLARAKEKGVLGIFARRRYLSFLGKVFDEIDKCSVLKQDYQKVSALRKEKNLSSLLPIEGETPVEILEFSDSGKRANDSQPEPTEFKAVKRI
jgi:hypothetical protein